MKLMTVGFMVSLGICWAMNAVANDTSFVETAWSGSNPANDVWKPVGPGPGSGRIPGGRRSGDPYGLRGDQRRRRAQEYRRRTPLLAGQHRSCHDRRFSSSRSASTIRTPYMPARSTSLYVSHDAGTTWTVTPNFLSAFAIAIDPNDANTVYTGSSAIQVSHDGGVTFTDITGRSSVWRSA